MDEPTKIKMPPPVRVFSNAKVPEKYLNLPFEAVEVECLATMDISIGIGLVCLTAILFYFHGFSQPGSFFMLGILVVMMLRLLVPGVLSQRRKRRFGLNTVYIAKDGLRVSATYSGILPWPEVAVVYPNFSNGKMHSVTIKLKNPEYLNSQLNDKRSKSSGHFKIPLGNFASQNSLGESIIAAANTYSGSHSAWAGLPLMLSEI
jgi:hypothetical protein